MTAVRVAVGEGSPEGVNSAYVLPECRAVVDPGPPGEATWSALVDGLADAGLAVEDVARVFVTHWHVDHAGLAPRLAGRADASLYMHEADAPLVGDYAAERERRVARDARTLARWGVPAERVEAVTAADGPSPLPDATPVEGLADGDRRGGVRLVAAPGHTLGHAAFAAGGDLFVGDALLPTYTPNVGGGDTRTTDALSAYLRALDRLAGTGGRARPGHGTALDLAAAVANARDHHARRADRVLAALRAAGTATPWAVARRLFGEMERVHVKMGAGEAAAHLARLADEGDAERVGDDPVRYRPADGRA